MQRNTECTQLIDKISCPIGIELHKVILYRASMFISSIVRSWPLHFTSLASNKENRTVSHARASHDDVIKWKYFPRYWPFVRRNHRSPVDSPHKCQWRGALMFSLIHPWTGCWASNRDAGDWESHRGHYDVIVMFYQWNKNCGRDNYFRWYVINHSWLTSTVV